MADSSAAALPPFQYSPSLYRFSFVTTTTSPTFAADSPAVVITIRRFERIFSLTRAVELPGMMASIEGHSFELELGSLTSPVVWHQAVTAMLSRFNFGPEAGYRIVEKLRVFRREAAAAASESETTPARSFEVDIEVGETVVAEALPMPTRNSFTAMEDFVGRLKTKGEEKEILGEEEDLEECCVICMEMYHHFPRAEDYKVAVEMSCLHVFHRDCMASWLSRRPVCPLFDSTVQILYP